MNHLYVLIACWMAMMVLGSMIAKTRTYPTYTRIGGGGLFVVGFAGLFYGTFHTIARVF